jgi:hypothetical protein
MTSAQQVCDLAAGRLAGWEGLSPFRLEAAPSCLGPPEREGWLDLGRGATAYRVCRTVPDHVEVWLFHPPGEVVCLVEVYPPATADPVGTLLDALGEPDLLYEYPLAGRLQRMLGRSGEGLDERVYGSRGLAVAVTHRAGREQQLFRLRGFRPARAEEYYADFVDLPEPRFLE